MTKPIHTVEINMRSLQQWRLVHALSEGERAIGLLPEYEDGVKHLQKYFKADIRFGDGVAVPNDLFEIDTLAPKTRVGELTRPLIVPHEVVDYCRTLWKVDRDVEFSFVGMNHWGRQRTVSEWHQRNFDDMLQILSLAESQSLSERTDAIVAQSQGQPVALVMFSKRGRSYPGKIWDDDFYGLLARTRFSLCPDGDQIWSYRFFESILCGAVPIIQSEWPAYAGFRYFTFSDPVGNLVYRPEDVEHNFALCRERLTLPREDLDRVLSAHLGDGASSSTVSAG